MNKKYKFKIGQIVCPNDCTAEGKKRFRFKVGFRRHKIARYTDEDVNEIIFYSNHYSETGTGWTREQLLEKEG